MILLIVNIRYFINANGVVVQYVELKMSKRLCDRILVDEKRDDRKENTKLLFWNIPVFTTLNLEK